MKYSEKLLNELVREAMKIAMFDCQWDDDSVPEVKSVRKEFKDAFREVLKAQQ